MTKQFMAVVETWKYLTKYEALALYALAENIENHHPVIVNIGAGNGTSGMILREARPDSTLITVDISPGGPYGGLRNERNEFAKTDLELPIQMLGDSRNVAQSWKGSKIDMIFIDDGHQEEDIRGDILYWYQHIVDGGIMSFHDYGSKEWPDVKRVVDGLLKNYDVIVHAGTLFAVRINKTLNPVLNGNWIIR